MPDAGWYRASKSLGCGGREAGEKTLFCMEKQPWKKILEVIRPKEKKELAANATREDTLAAAGESGPLIDEKAVFSNCSKRREKEDFIRRVSPHFLLPTKFRDAAHIGCSQCSSVPTTKNSVSSPPSSLHPPSSLEQETKLVYQWQW